MCEPSLTLRVLPASASGAGRRSKVSKHCYKYVAFLNIIVDVKASGPAGRDMRQGKEAK